MNRTTIMLPTALRAEAIKRARALKISLGELIRLSLQEQIAKPVASGALPDAFLADTAVFEGKVPGDLSTAHDKHIAGGRS